MAELTAVGTGRHGTSRQDLERGVVIHLVVIAVGMVVLFATALFAAAVGVDGSFLSREPQVALDGPLYAGTLSNLGALVWMLGAVMAFVGFATTSNRREQQMFLAGGTLGLVLLADDFFMLHDWVSGRSQAVEQVLILSYLLALVAIVVRFRAELGQLAVAGIGAMLVLFGVSIACDVFANDLDQIVEDGFKFLGICTWATTWTLRAHPWELRATAPAPADRVS